MVSKVPIHPGLLFSEARKSCFQSSWRAQNSLHAWVLPSWCEWSGSWGCQGKPCLRGYFAGKSTFAVRGVTRTVALSTAYVLPDPFLCFCLMTRTLLVPFSLSFLLLCFTHLMRFLTTFCSCSSNIKPLLSLSFKSQRSKIQIHPFQAPGRSESRAFQPLTV